MSKAGEWLLKAIDPLFPKPVHPFNQRISGDFSYADWQFEKGEDTIRYYLERYTADEMFRDKRVVDFGCGEGGKGVYFASLGAKDVTGIDIVPEYAERAPEVAAKHGCDNFTFILGDATRLELPADTYDTVIMNDFMEHVGDPQGALREALRILKPGGRAFINFSPYYHPYGAHLWDAVHVPWVHVLFREQTMIHVYEQRVRDLPDGDERIALRFSEDEKGVKHLTYINHMTIARFEGILKEMDITPEYYHLTPLRNVVSGLAKAKLPLLREPLNKMVTCVIRK